MKTIGLSIELVLKAFNANNNKIVDSSSSKANKMIINLFKNLIYIPNIRVTKKPTFLTFNTKKTFNQLQLAFIKALIF